MDSSPHHSQRHRTSLEDHYGKKLRWIEEKIAELGHRRGEREAKLHGTRPPFSQRIMAESILRHFKIPQVEPYDGTTDPLDHLASYKAHMMIQYMSDALYCLAFLATLKKSA